MRAFGPLTAAVRDAAPFPAGLVLHSWAGSAEFTAQLARLQGVHFSVSGQATRLSPAKAAAMLAQVPSCASCCAWWLQASFVALWLLTGGFRGMPQSACFLVVFDRVQSS